MKGVSTMEIGISASFYDWASLKHVMKMSLDAGFDGVEADLPRHLGDLLTPEEKPILALHLPKIPTVRWIFVGGILGKRNSIPTLICHPTIKPAQMWILSRFWLGFGVTLTVENIPPLKEEYPRYQKLLKPEVEVFERFEEIPATLDFGHAHLLGQNIPQLIEKLSERLRHIHIHDCDRSTDHLPIGEGTIGFESIFEVLGQVKFNGSVVLEASLEPDQLSSQATRLRNLIGLVS